MAVPIILSFLVRMAAKFGIAKARKMAVKKYGKEALKNITKSKPVKKVTELQRVKAQIKRDMLKPKVKTPKGKIVGKVRRNYGKWEPYTRPVKPKPKPKKP